MHCPVLHAEVTQQLAETINLDEGREREREGGEGRRREGKGEGEEGKERERDRERERREIVTASEKLCLSFGRDLVYIHGKYEQMYSYGHTQDWFPDAQYIS